MELIIQLFLTFIIGVIASAVASLGGSGGLLSIPFLMFTGIPANIAIATNKCGSVGLSIGSVWKFSRAKK